MKRQFWTRIWTALEISTTGKLRTLKNLNNSWSYGQNNGILKVGYFVLDRDAPPYVST